ncbi:hypothetical protein P4S72_23310 [Vibrio sp. PP-XX7]
MRIARYIPCIILLSGCVSTDMSAEKETVTADAVCPGTTQLPEGLGGAFEAVNDPVLLAKALGEPEKGKLCQGQVYQSKAATQVRLFRAWNSTNPQSQFGQWWAYQMPAGDVATYRSDYEICYQWSPLDVMVRCTLKPNTKVVVGTGQSAKCSEYLTYPTSVKQQVYIPNAKASLINCTTYTGVMGWR